MAHLQDLIASDLDDYIQSLNVKGDTIYQPQLFGELFPLYILRTWKKPGLLTRRTTVALVWPSGVEKGGFCARVVLDGTALELVVKCPTPLVHLDMMLNKWLTGSVVCYEIYHSKYAGFEECEGTTSLKL